MARRVRVQNQLSEIDYSADGTASTVGTAAAKALEERLNEVGVGDTHILENFSAARPDERSRKWAAGGIPPRMRLHRNCDVYWKSQPGRGEVLPY
jgi:hypothetical protein